jgi:hypothetical protein
VYFLRLQSLNYFAAAKKADWSWKYTNHSQIRECMNWERGRGLISENTYIGFSVDHPFLRCFYISLLQNFLTIDVKIFRKPIHLIPNKRYFWQCLFGFKLCYDWYTLGCWSILYQKDLDPWSPTPFVLHLLIHNNLHHTQSPHPPPISTRVFTRTKVCAFAKLPICEK